MLNKTKVIWVSFLCFGLCGLGCNDDSSGAAGDVGQCPTGQHVYETICELDDMQNCGGHGIACTSDQHCLNGGCQSNGNDPNPGETTLNCQAGQHVYGDVCEPDDMQNCGGHGIACSSDQQCLNGSCQPKGSDPNTEEVNCQVGQHVYGDVCEPDDMQNCGGHGIACASDQQCLNGSCQPKGNDPNPGETPVDCPAGQHAYGDSCEPDDMQNCGGHGVSCKYAQRCENGACNNIVCHYSTNKSERSPALCVDNHLLICGSSDTYYFDSKNGNCNADNPCIICPDGFGGCTSDETTFCKNHQKQPDKPTTCVSNVYPPLCVGNTGYICGSNDLYYSSASTRCSGTDQCVICQSGFIGCSSDPKAFCDAKNSSPVTDANQCTAGHRRCDGKKLMECDGTSYSKLVEICSDYCEDGSNGSNSSCTEYQPDCSIKNGSQFRVIGWNDGDTLVGVPTSEDYSCYSYEHVSIRVYHIDSPECSKSQNYSYSNIKTCIWDTVYTSTNDPYGYEAWEASTSMADKYYLVTLYCDNADEYNVCPTDTNGRYLAYVSVGDMDVSTELTRLGLAIPSLGRTAPQSEREKDICNALFDAVNHHRNLWSHCTTTDAQCVRDSVNKLKSTKEGEFDYIYERCQYITGLDVTSPTPEPSCTPGTDVCTSGVLYSCSDEGKLNFIKNCSDGCANDQECKTVAPTSCTPGESRCIDAKMYYCDENANLEFLQDCISSCKSNSECSLANSMEYCVNNVHYYLYKKNGSLYSDTEYCYKGCEGSSCQCNDSLDCWNSVTPLCVDNRCQFPENVSCVKNVSPALCGGDGDAYFCNTSGYYYHGKTCSIPDECYVCSNGFGGCTDDPSSFCH